MDPRANPFSPGAGTQPPELAGRDEIVQNATIALERVGTGRHARSQMLLGLRGVGKTVLLNRIEQLAAERGFLTIVLEAPEDKQLAELLVPPLRSRLVALSRVEQAKDIAKRALGVLRAFASAFKVKVGDIEFGVERASGTADSGSLEHDLPELLAAVATAAKSAGTGVAILVDEVQYLSAGDLGAVIVSLEYPEVGKLSDEAARSAIRAPVQREGVEITEEALKIIVEETEGYPYFLQEWGSQAWNAATTSPITAADARRATTEALNRLDQGFFRVRLDRLTPRERDYVRAMAELGRGPHRSGEIANLLGIQVTTAGPLRNGLIKKGMIYSQQHGETAFTVPMFDEFMRRSMPQWRLTKKGRRGRGK